jgi:hypothetical protein
MKTTDYVLILSSSVQAALQTMQEIEAREAKNASGGDHISDQLYELRSITLTLADQTKLLRERLDRLESIDTERRVHDSLNNTDYILILNSALQAAVQTMQQIEAREANRAPHRDLSDQLREIHDLASATSKHLSATAERLSRLEAQARGGADGAA